MVPTDVIGAIEDAGALLGTMLDQTHDCIKLLDRDGIIRYVNERCANALEPRTPAELVGSSWVELWPAESRSVAEQAADKARAGKVARFTAARVIGGKPSWWDVTVAPVRSNPAVQHVLVIARDMTAEVQERERVEAVSAEMRHRLRNAMTIASALMHMAARGKSELQAFAGEVSSRLAQLGTVQELILDPASKKTFSQIMALLGGVYGHLEIGPLPDVELDDRLMQAIALAFGELATNSLKYGALKHGSPVQVSGRVVGDELELVWREETVFGRSRDGGQGLDLIDRIVKASGGRIERRVEDRQFVVQAAFPLPPGES